MHICNGLGEEGDGQDDDDSDDKEDDGKIQVVHTADDRGTVAGLHAAPGSVGKLGNHTGHPDQKSYDQSPKGSLWKKSLASEHCIWETAVHSLGDRDKRITVREIRAPGHLKQEHWSWEHD